MKLLHITDLHLHGDPYALSDRRLKNCVIHLSNAHADADLCIITGDISENGTEAGYAAARDLLSELPFPVYATLGNHDCRQSAKAALPAFAWDAAGFCQRIVETASHTLILGRRAAWWCALLPSLALGCRGSEVGARSTRRLGYASRTLRYWSFRNGLLWAGSGGFQCASRSCIGARQRATSFLRTLSPTD